MKGEINTVANKEVGEEGEIRSNQARRKQTNDWDKMSFRNISILCSLNSYDEVKGG